MMPRAYRAATISSLALLLALPVAAQEEDEIPATSKPKDTWSRYGWEALRWGMGPGDVRAALPSAAEIRWHPGTIKRSGDMIASAGWKAHGAECVVKLSFLTDTLTKVTLTPDCRHSASPRIECASWAESVRAFYDKAAGPARCTQKGKTEQCAWERDDFRVVLEVYQHQYTFASLTFADPEWYGTRPTKAELTAKTEPQTWKTDGWYEFRWGMGIGDVEAKLKSGETKSTREMICHRPGSEENGMDCQLESTYHFLRVLDRSPEFRFSFVNGLLYSVTLDLSPTEDPSLYEEVAASIGVALSDKYGVPARDSNRNGFLHKEWTRETLEVYFNGYKSEREPLLSIHYFDPASRGQIRRKGMMRGSEKL